MCKVADIVEFSVYHSTAMKEDVDFENLFDFRWLLLLLDNDQENG